MPKIYEHIAVLAMTVLTGMLIVGGTVIIATRSSEAENPTNPFVTPPAGTPGPVDSGKGGPPPGLTFLTPEPTPRGIGVNVHEARQQLLVVPGMSEVFDAVERQNVDAFVALMPRWEVPCSGRYYCPGGRITGTMEVLPVGDGSTPDSGQPFEVGLELIEHFLHDSRPTFVVAARQPGSPATVIHYIVFEVAMAPDAMWSDNKYIGLTIDPTAPQPIINMAGAGDDGGFNPVVYLQSHAPEGVELIAPTNVDRWKGVGWDRNPPAPGSPVGDSTPSPQ